jgi:translation initiation factor IF-3
MPAPFPGDAQEERGIDPRASPTPTRGRRSSGPRVAFWTQEGRRTTTQHQYRINDMIRIRQVRLIDDTGAMVGIVDTEVARQMAYDKGLDLVEVSPEARPPVCKVMDYGKFLYTLKKKEHDSKRKQRQIVTKEVRLRPKIAEHDVGYKAKQARDFLLDGDKVQVTMLFRGREMSHMDVARVVLDKFVAKLSDISKVERSAKMEGRRLSLLLISTVPPRVHEVPKGGDHAAPAKKETKQEPSGGPVEAAANGPSDETTPPSAAPAS